MYQPPWSNGQQAWLLQAINNARFTASIPDGNNSSFVLLGTTLLRRQLGHSQPSSLCSGARQKLQANMPSLVILRWLCTSPVRQTVSCPGLDLTHRQKLAVQSLHESCTQSELSPGILPWTLQASPFQCISVLLNVPLPRNNAAGKHLSMLPGSANPPAAAAVALVVPVADASASPSMPSKIPLDLTGSVSLQQT